MDPFQNLSPGSLLKSLLILLVVTLGCFLAIAATNQSLENAAAPLGILSLQFAGELSNAVSIINSWNETARLYAAFNLGLDSLFLVCYSLFLSLTCSYQARSWRHDFKGFSTAGFLLAWAMFATAVLDMIENYALWQLLLGSTNAHWPTLATLCATLKFGLILAGIGYIASGLLVRLRRVRR